MIKKIFTYSGFPFWFFHVPIFPYYLYLSVKRSSLAFFTNTNPSIFTGGFVNDAKTEYIKTIHPDLIPKYIYIEKKLSLEVMKEKINTENMSFPFILKPNRGERGKGVVKINTIEELEAQLNICPDDFLLQEYINYPLEYGVLYYKFPNGSKDGITSICYKELPYIVGDGINTIQTLIETKYKTDALHFTKKNNTAAILEKNQTLQLDYVAHRNRKCVFKNYNHIYCPEILNTFREISSQIDGFYFGRYDIKANSLQDLIEGKNIKILEINGVGSQPIHIFDPNYSFLRTYYDLIKHWKLIATISKQNQKRGFSPIPFKLLYNEIKSNK